MVDLWLFDLIRIVPLLIIFAIAAYQDLTRTVRVKDGQETFVCGTVTNKLWLYTPFGLIVTVIQLSIVTPLIPLSIASIILSWTVATLFFMFNGWGGADAKAFMMLSVSMPVMPIWSSLFPVPLPFTVLFVSCACAVVYGLLKKSTVPFKERKVRFLPFMFAGLIISFFL